MTAESTMNLPIEYEWGWVQCRVLRAIADTTKDANRIPESISPGGAVVFKPRTRRTEASMDYNAFVLHGDETAIINERGEMVDAEGLPGIALVVGVYDVTFDIPNGDLPKMTIEVKSTHTQENPLYLPSQVSYTPPVGTLVQTMVVPAGLPDDSVLSKNGSSWTAIPKLDFKGAQGDQGPIGFDAYEVAVQSGFEGTRLDWLLYQKGQAGISAYQVAVQEGFPGSEADWLLTLKGEKGDGPGAQTLHELDFLIPPDVGDAGWYNSIPVWKSDHWEHELIENLGHGPKQYSGFGRPDIPSTTGYSASFFENVNTGSTWFSTNSSGNTGARVWQKFGTVWKVVKGDTGFRQVAGVLNTAIWGAGTVHVCRKNDQIFYALHNLWAVSQGQGNNGVSIHQGPLPVEFRADTGVGTVGRELSWRAQLFVYSGNICHFGAYPDNTGYGVFQGLAASTNWPTTLVGTETTPPL